MVLAAASPPQEIAERSEKRGFGAAAPDYRAEVSEVRKKLIGSIKHLTLPLVAAASPLHEKAKRSGKRGFGGGSPRQPNQVLRRRS